MALTDAEAAELYREGASACVIARDHKMTKSGAEQKIRKGGINGGVHWCPIHRTYEELH